MQKHTTWRRLDTYTVNTQLIQKIAEYIRTKIPSLLSASGGGSYKAIPVPFADYTILTLNGLDNSTIYRPIGAYNQPLFDNDIQSAKIELNYVESGSSGEPVAIQLLIRFGHEREESEFSVTVNDKGAREKAQLIEDSLMTVLAPHKNRNKTFYPNDFFPTLVFVAGFLIGLCGLGVENRFLKAFCAIFFGGAFYFVAHRFTQGYCSFYSKHQKRLNVFLRGITVILILFVIGAIATQFYFMARKH
ncbi:hypothetical protein ACX0G9_01190 [Flavitalea flava]